MARSEDESPPTAPIQVRLPDVSGCGRPRRIYVDCCPPDIVQQLKAKGYEPVELMSMPRESEGEQLAYLRAKLQGYEERTVEADEEDRKRLELEARAWGMLGAKTRQLNVNVDASSDDVSKLLDWDSGRHTLAENTTAVFAQAPQKKLKPKAPKRPRKVSKKGDREGVT